MMLINFVLDGVLSLGQIAVDVICAAPSFVMDAGAKVAKSSLQAGDKLKKTAIQVSHKIDELLDH